MVGVARRGGRGGGRGVVVVQVGMRMTRHHDAISVLEALGVRFLMDWDGETGAELPESLDEFALRTIIDEMRPQIVHAIRERTRKKLQVLHGGPLRGQRHNEWRVYVRNMERAQWAAYWIDDDGRGFFVGIESSEAKARLAAHRAWTAQKAPV